MEKKFLSDPEFGKIVLRKNVRSHGISLRIKGKADRDGCRISVTLPWFSRYKDGEEFLGKKRDWIREAMAKQDRRSMEAAERGKAIIGITDGTCVETLLSRIVFTAVKCQEQGKRMAVKITCSPVENPEDTARLWLSPGHPLFIKRAAFPETATQQGLAKVLVEILRDEARLLLEQKTDYLAETYGFHFARLTIKHNSSNWGSCSTAGNINLNLNLVRLPEPLCDYVILHELCHLKEPNHGRRFHEMLEALCISNIRHLINIGSPDAAIYSRWICGNNENLSPLNEVLSREISGWKMI